MTKKSSLKKDPSGTSGDLLLALSRRDDSDILKRIEARSILLNAIKTDQLAVTSALNSLLEKEVCRTSESLGSDKLKCWIPLDDEKSEGSAAFDTVFAVGTARDYLRTEFYTLIGPTSEKGSEIQKGNFFYFIIISF